RTMEALHFWGFFSSGVPHVPLKQDANGNHHPVDLPDGRFVATGAHGPGFADYSHGIRLVHPSVWFPNKEFDIELVLRGLDQRPEAAEVRKRLASIRGNARGEADPQDGKPWKEAHYPRIFDDQGRKIHKWEFGR